jgi:hypothetical protein
VDSFTLYRHLWNLPAYFACNINSPDKADLDDHWVSARTRLVCDPSATDPLLWSRGRTSIQKDAESDLMAVTRCVVLLASLRGGADLYDNPRYRTILFLWQSILAGYVWVWWRETRSLWLPAVLACEIVFVLVFTQWYLSRYLHWGGQLPFAVMIGLILGLWGLILGVGWWQDQKSPGKRA